MDRSWVYPPLAMTMEEAVLEEVETYATLRQNTFSQCISTNTIVDMCLVAEWRPRVSVSHWWWG